MRHRIPLAVALCAALALLLGSLVGCGKPPEPRSETPLVSRPKATQAKAAGVELKMLAPCGMTAPIEAAAQAFEAANPGVKIKTEYDNSVIIAKRMVEKGESCDIFISPGARQLAIIQKAGKVDDSTVTPITSFELVCIVPRSNPAKIARPEDMPKAKALSMPDPEVDSVGYAGRQAMQKLGVWEKVQKKLVTNEHAIEAHNLVSQGKSQAGVSFANCPIETNPEKLSLSKIAIAFTFPAGSYDPVDGLAAVTTDCAHPQEARAFVKFMASPDGQAALTKHGLKPLRAGASAPPAGGKAPSATG